MTIALNIVLAVIVFAGIVGLIAFNILASREPVSIAGRPRTAPVPRPRTRPRAGQTRPRAASGLAA